MSERSASDSEIIDKQYRLLKVYRGVSGYTISALEGAIDNLMDSIATQSDEVIKDLMSQRLKELELSLQTITTDYE